MPLPSGFYMGEDGKTIFKDSGEKAKASEIRQAIAMEEGDTSNRWKRDSKGIGHALRSRYYGKDGSAAGTGWWSSSASGTRWSGASGSSWSSGSWSDPNKEAKQLVKVGGDYFLDIPEERIVREGGGCGGGDWRRQRGEGRRCHRH